MASENSWGYTRIEGALKNLGHEVGRNTIKRILQENGIDPEPERGKRMSWATFIKAHLGGIVGMDFFTVEAMTWRGLVRYHVLFAIDIASRKVEILGIAVNPGGPWMEEMARNLVGAIDGFLLGKTNPRPSRRQDGEVARTQSEPECLCGTLCAFDQERVP